MCGIWALFGSQTDIHECSGKSFSKISHRGPDAWRMQYDNDMKNCHIGFHRLAIVDCTYGMQPMRLHQYPNSTLICNGELYNCKELKEEFAFEYETFSDVECITHLYHKFGIEKCVKNLDGVFSFCIVDKEKRKIFLARDPYGVRPLFRLHTKDGVLAISSEAKGIVAIAAKLETQNPIEPFKPGTFAEYDVMDDGTTKLVREVLYHSPGDKPSFKTFVSYDDLVLNEHYENVRKLFTMAVKKRLMSHRRIGCLLSGGLDSSLTASILVKAAEEAKLKYKIQTFSIGMVGSPDLIAAKEVANHIGSEHYEIIFDENDIEKVLDEVLYTLETPDITTVRASVCMFLIAKFIKENTESTVLFSGEGADEVAQGYIYFRDAPNATKAHEDSLRLLREIYLFDGLRADRTISSQGLELRLPFLDLQFTNYYLNMPKELISPKDGTVEKYILRSAFAGTNALPDNILWRHKEAFSDGVTTSKRCLFHILQEIIDLRMPGPFDQIETAKKYPYCTPTSKESLYYRQKIEEMYPNCIEKIIPFYWMPKWTDAEDPSARFIKHHHEPRRA